MTDETEHLTVAELRDVWMARVMRELLNFQREVESERAEGERAGYADKARALEAWAATGSLDGLPARIVAMLEAERAETGESMAELLASISARPDPFSVAAGKLAGIRRRAATAIAAATTRAEMRAILADVEARIALARQAVADAHRGG